ncbi:rhodanese-like domain-containing protein [cyanobacterium endosymbiont of Epithemia turgida]|uniref:rhodanese-like domain-containing protein n=1 Tax=cyanobacterium endosymbiont of Epithemia turgida TaxID=718217 RepID=UPI0004D1D495|nr:rhodanese-like domain-containing protein [cyanobacterium endosymbiont of Epithemia turgida]BAP17839.1 rhodanese [cyanobacterium endosymbiont of Epithemia turgida isolate EtSB Lake Yunoko]
MPQNLSIPQITVTKLAERLAQAKDELQLIDVRELHEVMIAYIEGFTVLSLSEFERWSDKIATDFNPHAETFVICHHGMRSAQMCRWLLNNGFTNVSNIIGGIDAYALYVDPTIPHY